MEAKIIFEKFWSRSRRLCCQLLQLTTHNYTLTTRLSNVTFFVPLGSFDHIRLEFLATATNECKLISAYVKMTALSVRTQCCNFLCVGLIFFISGKHCVVQALQEKLTSVVELA